jgi:hypothetical protein
MSRCHPCTCRAPGFFLIGGIEGAGVDLVPEVWTLGGVREASGVFRLPRLRGTVDNSVHKAVLKRSPHARSKKGIYSLATLPASLPLTCVFPSVGPCP